MLRTRVSHLATFASLGLGFVIAVTVGTAAADSPPVVTAPAQVNGSEGDPIAFDVTVTEPDGDEITELRAEGLPDGATFQVESSNAAGHFAWTPGFDRSGTFSIRIAAASVARASPVSEPIPLEGSATVRLVVANVNRPPIVTPLPDVFVSGGESATIQMLATDPDGTGSFIYALVSAPPFITRVNAFLYMEPALADTGEVDASYSISDGEATATGSVHVVVTGAPSCGAQPIAIGPPYRILVDASRDGGLWWAPQDGFYDPNQPHLGRRLADNLRGRGIDVQEIPRRAESVKTSVVDFQILSNFDLVIRVNGGTQYSAEEMGGYSCYLANGGKVIFLSDARPPGEEDLLAEWLDLDFRGESRGENKITTLTPHPITDGMTSLVYGVGSGIFATPNPATILGTLSPETFIDLDGNGTADPAEPTAASAMGVVQWGSGTCFFLGDVNVFLGVPQPLVDNLLRYFYDDPSYPLLQQPKDMTVRAGTIVEQTIHGSDPDGATDLIFNRVDGPRYMRVFDTGASTGFIRLSPRLSEVGSSIGVVRVSDGLLEDRKELRLKVTDQEPDPLAARAFLHDGHRTIPLGAGPPTLCFQVEPVDGAYENAAVDPTLWKMVSSASGAAREIPAVQGKSVALGDRDKNGIQEVAACFRREDMRLLAPGLRGRSELPVEIQGGLVGGERILAPMTLRVVGLGPGRQAVVTPNPARGSATLLYRTEREGPVVVRLFDARGRLVRRIHSNPSSGVGYHEVLMEARDANGSPLPSGAYFYRIDAPEGRTTGRWIVIR